MDRIFQKSSIEQICDDIKKILKKCKEQMEDMKTIASDAEKAAGEVPWDVYDSGVAQAASALRTAIDNVDFDTVLTKLDNCKTRAATLIPAADTQYAAETDQLAATAKQVKDAISQLRDFLVNTPLTTDYSQFLVEFDSASTKWEKVLDNADAALEELKTNIKGAEEISQVFSKDPVNLSTGNFIYDRTDLETGGSSPLSFRRFYNALNDREGVLGKDWNHNYEVFLEGREKEKTLVLEDGKEEHFILASTGVYTSVYQSNGMLEQKENGFVYRTRDQRSYFFDGDGYCLLQVDLSGESVSLSYQEVQGTKQLTAVEKDSGEFFRFAYDEQGYLKEVQDHTGRKVCCHVQDGHLMEVVTPLGHRFHYGYTLEGKLESVETPGGITTVENRYDEQQRIVFQSFPDGGSMSYAYNEEKRTVELTERNGSRVTYVHDSRYRDIRHIYSDGEERFEYNRENQKTLAVDKLGNKTQYAYDTRGNLTRIINALGVKAELAYERHNQPVYLSVDGKEKLRNHYDEKGNLSETTDALGNTFRFTYQKQGHPERILQPDGSELRIRYDGRGNIIELTDAAGSISRYRYDGLNRVIGTTDGNGNVTGYEYDAEGNITKVTNPQGDVRSYLYNENGKVTEIRDFDGSTVNREYNVLNRPSKVTDQQGRSTLLSYDTMWNLARITEPNGAKTTFIYDEYNRLVRVRNACGDVVRYTYDAVGNRTGITDESGEKTSFTYDALGQLIRAEGPEGAQMSYAYDAEGNVTCVTDALGNTVYLEYDVMGNLVKETNPLGESRSYTYTPLGDVRTATDEAGLVTTYTYEAGGRLAEITHPDQTTESYTYDNNGNVKTYTDQKGYTLNYSYDTLDQVVEISGMGGWKKCYAYDSVGNVTFMTDSLGYITRYEYSLSGQLTRVIDALGNETEYGYDACDRLLEIRQYGEVGEAQGMDEDLKKVRDRNCAGRSCQITRYERDLSGRITRITDALGQTEAYDYDKKGQLISKLDKEGYLTKYCYTPLGDVSSIQYADGKEVKLSYNPLRQLKEMEDWLGITRIENDPLGRARKVTYPDGKETAYTYGTSGERTSITYPDGKRAVYGYDRYTRLSSLTQGGETITYGYDEAGFLTRKTFPNGVETTYQYDIKGQIRSLVHCDQKGILDQYTYEYDLLGNKTAIEKQRRGLEEESGRYSYWYDPMGRLQGVAKDGKRKRAYAYDAFGNRTGMAERGKKTSYTYNALNQLTSKTSTGAKTQYTYDHRGNLSQIFENGQVKNQYVYGALNRLEEAMNQKGEIARYIYNGLGHRVGKQAGTKNGQPEVLFKPGQMELALDPVKRLEGENFRPTSQVDYIIDYTRQFNNLLQKKENGRRQTYIWDGFAAGVINKEKKETLSYFLQDDLSSPVRLMGEDGEIQESYGYGEFGEDLYRNQGIAQPFGYTGYQRDLIAETYYAQAREYSPENGRFTSRDLIKGEIPYPITLNEYIYCGNSPFYYVDVDGMFWHIICGALVGAVANTVISVGTSLIKGEPITIGKVLSTIVGGAVGGAVTAATGNTTAGAMAGGAAERIALGVAEGKNAGDIIQDVAVGAVTDFAFSKVTKVIGNSQQAKQITSKFKSTKLGEKIFKSNANYKRQITRGRNAFTKKEGWKVIKLSHKTYVNGFWGVTGTKALNKFINDTTEFFPAGVDVKAELKKFLDNIYEEGEDWLEERARMVNYMNKELDKMLKGVTNEELANILCIDRSI